MGTMDELINREVVADLQSTLTSVAPGTTLGALASASRSLDGRRLRDRVDLVRDALADDLPGDFASTRRIVEELLENPGTTGWVIWPVSEFVAVRALTDGSASAFDAGMELLALLTVRLSSEFAIRELLNARPERAVKIARDWTSHEDEHVRRLASEGTRAYLPWAKRVPWLVEHPDATRSVIDALYRDPSEYVRRSAANHLNDLSRIDDALVVTIARGWSEHPDATTPRVVRHGLRTLVKRGHAEALELLGFGGGDLRVHEPQLASPAIPVGGELEFTAHIENAGDADAVAAIDYTVGFRRANGSISPKTFKLTTRTIAPGERVIVTKRHSLRPITTRRYYAGEHYVSVQANGIASSRTSFELLDTVDVVPP